MIGRVQTAVEYVAESASPWGELKLLEGSANPALAAKISAELGVPLTDTRMRRFADGEINVKIEDSMRGHDVFVIQPTCPPVNEHLMELHAEAIEGFFDVPTDHLSPFRIFADYLRTLNLHNLTVVAPDAGGGRRAEAVANQLQAPIAFGYKRRPEEDQAEVIAVSGDVKGRDCVV